MLCGTEFRIAKDIPAEMRKFFLNFLKESELVMDQFQTEGALEGANYRSMMPRQEQFPTKLTICYPHWLEK